MAQPARVRLPRIEHPADHPLMTVQKVAELLGCSDMTIRRRISARQFPAVKIGRKSMIPRSFVERLLAQAEAGQTVVVDEAVEQWGTQPQTQMSPGGIAARRGDASLAPDEELSTQDNGNGRWAR
jgi:excisionase family DNA binding protein